MSIDYTPKSICEVVFGSQKSKDTINNITNGIKPFPVAGRNGILLFGVPGTGKSTLAELLPKAIERQHTGNIPIVDLFRIQQGENGARLIASINDQCRNTPLCSKHHYFILDEVDNLTKDAMKSLRSLMNLRDTIFILTTNNMSIIEIGVRDRCHKVEFNKADASLWFKHVKRILNDFGATTPPDSHLKATIDACDGSARDITDAAIDMALRLGGVMPKQVAATSRTPLFTVVGNGIITGTP